MHRIDTDTAQADKFGAGKNGFTGGNPQTGRLPTALDEDFFDAVQEEISRVIEAAGISLDKTEYGQLLQALGLLYAPLSSMNNKQDKHAKLTAFSALTGGVDGLGYFTGNDTMEITALTSAGRQFIAQSSITNMLTYLGALKITNYLSEISSAGTAAQAAAVANLGIGDGSLIPVGVPIPYFASTAPSGWILCNGASFSAINYPKLAAAYPNLVLPDLRGNVIRGWDNGRGIDASRAILSEQLDAAPNITGVMELRNGSLMLTPTGAFARVSGVTSNSPNFANAGTADSTTFDASRSSASYGRSGSTEVRMRNIAFNYILRAA